MTLSSTESLDSASKSPVPQLSVVMPTFNRRHMLPGPLNRFLRKICRRANMNWSSLWTVQLTEPPTIYAALTPHARYASLNSPIKAWLALSIMELPLRKAELFS